MEEEPIPIGRRTPVRRKPRRMLDEPPGWQTTDDVPRSLVFVSLAAGLAMIGLGVALLLFSPRLTTASAIQAAAAILGGAGAALIGLARARTRAPTPQRVRLWKIGIGLIVFVQVAAWIGRFWGR